MIKKILFLIASFTFSKILLNIFKKILYLLIIFFTCGVLFHFWLYPKIQEKRNLKDAFDYFKFLDKLENTKIGEFKFIKSENNNDAFKFLTTVKQFEKLKITPSEKIEILKNLKLSKKHSLVSNIKSINLANLSNDISYIETFNKKDILYKILLENKLIDILIESKNKISDYEKLVKKYPEIIKIEDFKQIKEIIKKSS